MAVTSPRISNSWRLNQNDAKRLWNWILQRQGLSADTGFTSLLKTADATLGFHSARLPSPFTTALTRVKAHPVALDLFKPETRKTLVTLRCMRKTLHTLPPSLAAIAHGATKHFRIRDAIRNITKSGTNEVAIYRVTNKIVDLLADSTTLSPRAIEEHMGYERYSAHVVRLTLKLAWERGTISYVNQSSGWNRGVRAFGLTSKLYPNLDMSVEREQATGELVREYFDRYGPATLRDVAWWSGLSRAAIVVAMHESSRDFSEVQTSWCDSPMYMYSDRLEEFRNNRQPRSQVTLDLLAHEDVALKAYFESRTRYLGSRDSTSAFNRIGEVLPTVVSNGEVIGTWKWNPRARQVEYSMLSRYTPPEIQALARLRSQQMTEGLRLGLVG